MKNTQLSIRKFIVIISCTLFSLLSVTQKASAAPYCTSNGGTGWEYISGFSINGASQNSAAGGYQDYTGSTFTTLADGGSYSFTITYTIPGSVTGVQDQAAIYMDLNNDGDFDDAAETLYASGTQTMNNGTHTFSSSITIPGGTSIGTKRMRVVLLFVGAATSMSPCLGNYSGDGGETEDYDVEIGAACSMTASITAQTNNTCNGGNAGSLTVTQSSGTANFSFAWSNGSNTSNTASNTNTISSLVAGTYTVTVTDAGSCTSTASATITQPVAVTMTATQTGAAILCYGQSTDVDLSVNNGTGPYTIGHSITFIAQNGNEYGPYGPYGGFSIGSNYVSEAGRHDFTVTDANSCTATASVTISGPMDQFEADVWLDNTIQCNGQTASVSVMAMGGISPYSGQGSFTRTAGNYTFTVTDANGCTATESVNITEPTTLSVTLSVDNNETCAGHDGGATAAPSGGTPVYGYVWNNSAVTASITGVSAGTYTATVTDANGCTASNSTSLTLTGTCIPTWVGTGNWTDNPNWSNVPGVSDSVVIQSGTLTVDTDASINDLTLETGANIVVTAGNTLTVTGNYINNGGSFNVQPGGVIIFENELRKNTTKRAKAFGKLRVLSGSITLTN